MIRRALLLVAIAQVACGAPDPAPGTGGTQIEAGACGRGVMVVETDYQSTNVSLIGWDGAVLSASFISSASTSEGISAPLTVDVDVPTAMQTGARVAVLDRYPAGVVTWADVSSADVAAQLSLNVGDFQANPQDYVEVRPGIAYVSRYNPNLGETAGTQPFDGGSDVAIVDVATPALVGTIDLAPAMEGEDPSFHPRPNRIVATGDRAWVLLSGYSASFDASAESRLVTIDTATDSLIETTVLDGMHGCAGLALSPDRTQLAVACSGTFTSDQSSILAESGLVLLDLAGPKPLERTRIPASALGDGGLGFKIVFVDDDTVAFTLFGHDATAEAAALDDVLVAVDLQNGEVHELLRSAGTPFTLGDIVCAPECSTCIAADAEREGGVVHRFAVDGPSILHDRALRVESTIGLPPRYLGRF